MNQNNYDEYEIIDSHNLSYPFNRDNGYSKHSLPQNSNQPLQNKNPRDYLNVNYQNVQYNKNPEFFDTDTVTAISAGIIVAGTMLGAFTAPVTAGLIISFGTLMPIFWPQGERDNTVWISFIRMGEKFVDTQLTETIREQKLASLAGLRQVLDNYEAGYNSWKILKDQQNPELPPSPELRQAAQTVKTRFEIAHNDFIREIPGFQLPTYKAILLPMYAQVTNLHLNLLQQGVKWADTWNADIFPPQTEFETNAGTSDGYYQLLIKNIPEYSNYCTNTYTDMLDTLKEETNMKWNTYNAYRFEMTLTVLDLIAVFPLYDTKKYDHSIGISSEFTREIYTVALIDPYADKHFKIADIEASLTSRPDLFTWIQSLIFYNRRFVGNVPGLTANSISYLYTNSPQIIHSSIYGDITEGDVINRFVLPSNQYVYNILMTHLRDTGIIEKITFSLTNLQKIFYETGLDLRPFELETINVSIPGKDSSLPPTYNNYSHVLSYIKTAPGDERPSTSRARNICFGWTHSSVDPNNTIYTDKTSQIPAVKANELNYQAEVLKGPGHTGGNVIHLPPESSFSMTCQTSSNEQKYFIRIRYASNALGAAKPFINLLIPGIFTGFLQLNQTFSHKNFQKLQYQEFKYLEFVNEVILPANRTIFLKFGRLDEYSDTDVVIDKIEFLPITSSLQKNRDEQKIEVAKMKIRSFFTNHKKTLLQADVTDYEIDQTAILIDSLTAEVYPQEKLILLNEIKHVKRLSKSRNLLQNGDFTSLFGWTTSNGITIQAGDCNFKGFSLRMAGARITEVSRSIFPTYIYQKIQESILKPYTRYIIRGCVKQSKNMEVVISRYEEEHHMTLNEANPLASINFYAQANIGEIQETPFNNINNHIFGNPQEFPHGENIAYFGQAPHKFSYTIDTGELDIIENLGIELMFKISDSDGFAILDNLEVIEERLLTREEIQKIHERENRWKTGKQKQQKEAEIAYSQAQQAITHLFTTTQFPILKLETTLQDITMANHLLDRIPNVYHRWLPNKPGSNHNLFIQLKDHISKAYSLYDSRNLIQNGDFNVGLKHWSTTLDAKINEKYNKSILVIPSWSTQVSQHLHVKPNSQYLLRVRGKKDGSGNGYVKISDARNHIETLTFTSNANYTDQMWNGSEGFITKILSITPYTNQLRIDIGETEGTFMIESIELFDIKG